MRVVHVTKFIPLFTAYGLISHNVTDVQRSLRRIEEGISASLNELALRIGGERKNIISNGVSIAQVNIGAIVGLLVVAWAYVED